MEFMVHENVVKIVWVHVEATSNIVPAIIINDGKNYYGFNENGMTPNHT